MGPQQFQTGRSVGFLPWRIRPGAEWLCRLPFYSRHWHGNLSCPPAEDSVTESRQFDCGRSVTPVRRSLA
jgi:hypothetical protein